MGEPAMPTPADRQGTRRWAAAIVDSVRNDEEMDLPIPDDSPTAFENFIFVLAQEITLLQAERDSGEHLIQKLGEHIAELRAK
jgi:hypothetical protein